MDNKFIEITDVTGDEMLINVAHVVSVEVLTHSDGCKWRTQINLVDGTRPKTYESFEDIKKKIENAGKAFITNGIYV